MAKRKLEPVIVKSVKKRRSLVSTSGVRKQKPGVSNVRCAKNKRGQKTGNKNNKVASKSTKLKILQYAANPDCESAEDLLQPLQKDGDTVLEVECGTNKAHLYLSKLCQGSKGSCIEYDGSWLTPNEFQAASGRESAKDWKRSIRHYEKSLKLLLAKGVITLPSNSCDSEGNAIPRKRQEKCRLKAKRTKAIYRRKKLKVVDQNIPKKRSNKPVMKRRMEILLPKKRDTKNRENAKPVKKATKRAYRKSIINGVDLSDKYSITSVENGKIIIACDKSGGITSRKGERKSPGNAVVMKCNEATNEKGRERRRCPGRRRYRDENTVDNSTEDANKNEKVDNDEHGDLIIENKQIKEDDVKVKINFACGITEEREDISAKMKIYDFSDEIEPFQIKCHLDSKGLGVIKGDGAPFNQCIIDEEINDMCYRQGQNDEEYEIIDDAHLETHIKTDIIRDVDEMQGDQRENVIDNKELSDYEEDEIEEIKKQCIKNSENCDNIIDAFRQMHENLTGNVDDIDNNDDCDEESDVKDDSDDDDSNDDTSNDVGWTELSQCESALGDSTCCDMVEEETMDYSTSLEIDDDYDDIQEVPKEQNTDNNDVDDNVDVSEANGKDECENKSPDMERMEDNVFAAMAIIQDINSDIKRAEGDELTTDRENLDENDILSTNICLRLECSVGIDSVPVDGVLGDTCEVDAVWQSTADGTEHQQSTADGTEHQEHLTSIKCDATKTHPETTDMYPPSPQQNSPKIPSGSGSNREERLHTIIAQLRERTARVSPSTVVPTEHRTLQGNQPQNQYGDEKAEHRVSNDQETLRLDGDSLNGNSCDYIRPEVECISDDGEKEAIKCNQHDTSVAAPLAGIVQSVEPVEPCDISRQSADPSDSDIDKAGMFAVPDMNGVMEPCNERRTSGDYVANMMITENASVYELSHPGEENLDLSDHVVKLSHSKQSIAPEPETAKQEGTSSILEEESPVFANKHNQILDTTEVVSTATFAGSVDKTSALDIFNKLIELGTDRLLKKDDVTDAEEDTSEYIDVVDSMSGDINGPRETVKPEQCDSLYTNKTTQHDTVGNSESGYAIKPSVKTTGNDIQQQTKIPKDNVLNIETLTELDDSVSDDNPLVIDFTDSEINDTKKDADPTAQIDDSNIKNTAFNEQTADLASDVANTHEKQAIPERKQSSSDDSPSQSDSRSDGHCIKRLTGRRKHKLTESYDRSTDIQVQQIVSEIKRSVESALTSSGNREETLASSSSIGKPRPGENTLLQYQYQQLHEKNEREAKFQTAQQQPYHQSTFMKHNQLNRKQSVAAVRPRKKEAGVDKLNRSPIQASTAAVSSNSHMHLPPGVSYAMPIATGGPEQLAALRGEHAHYTEYMNALAASQYQYPYMMPHMYPQTGSSDLTHAYGMNGITPYPYSTVPYYLPQMMASDSGKLSQALPPMYQYYPTPHLPTATMSQPRAATAASLLSSLSSILSPSKNANANRPNGSVPVSPHPPSNKSAPGKLKNSRQQQMTAADYLRHQRSAKRKDTDSALDLSVKKTKLDCNASPAADANHPGESGHAHHKHNCGANCEGHSLETESSVRKQSHCPSRSPKTPSVGGCQCKQLNPLSNWTCDEVCTFLCALDGCAMYAERFRKQCVNGRMLAQLTADHLIHNFGMNIGPAIMLSRTVAKLLVITRNSGCEKCLAKNHDTHGSSVYNGSRLFASGR